MFEIINKREVRRVQISIGGDWKKNQKFTKGGTFTWHARVVKSYLFVLREQTGVFSNKKNLI